MDPGFFLGLESMWTFLYNILGPISSSPIPVPAAVLFQYSVNKPLDGFSLTVCLGTLRRY